MQVPQTRTIISIEGNDRERKSRGKGRRHVLDRVSMQDNTSCEQSSEPRGIVTHEIK